MVYEGAGAACADSIHPLINTAGEVNDLGILAAQFNGYVSLGRVVLKGGSHGYHLLDKGGLQMGG